MPSLKYKRYVGTFAYDEEADAFHGRVVGLRDVITFEERSIERMKKAFAESVEDYLDFCRGRGEKPANPSSGKFLIRHPAPD